MNDNRSIKVLIALNILIYILMSLTTPSSFIVFDGLHLIHWGGLTKDVYITGEYWRLITSAFLHGGIQHLLFNMYCLYVIGKSLLMFIDNKQFIIIYLLSGLSSSVTSSIFGNYSVSVGASGAIFGIAGYFTMFLLILKQENPQLNINIFGSIGFFLIINLLFGFMMPGIDNYAHIGGMLMGMGLFFIYRKES